jgi:hypothetical protein
VKLYILVHHEYKIIDQFVEWNTVFLRLLFSIDFVCPYFHPKIIRGLYLKFGLYRILVYSGFSLDQFHCIIISFQISQVDKTPN